MFSWGKKGKSLAAADADASGTGQAAEQPMTARSKRSGSLPSQMVLPPSLAKINEDGTEGGIGEANNDGRAEDVEGTFSGDMSRASEHRRQVLRSGGGPGSRPSQVCHGGHIGHNFKIHTK